MYRVGSVVRKLGWNLSAKLLFSAIRESKKLERCVSYDYSRRKIMSEVGGG